jgi:hypothetical protein
MTSGFRRFREGGLRTVRLAIVATGSESLLPSAVTLFWSV